MLVEDEFTIFFLFFEFREFSPTIDLNLSESFGLINREACLLFTLWTSKLASFGIIFYKNIELSRLLKKKLDTAYLEPNLRKKKVRSLEILLRYEKEVRSN